MRAPLALVFFLLISTNQVWTKFSQLSDVEARIYKELENAIDNIIILDTLRNVLVEASESGIIQLLLNITVDYIPSVNCNYSSWYEEAAFCKLKSGIWTLCTRDPLSINWTSTSQTSEWMNGFTYYTVPLYGNFLSICIAEALGTSMDSLNPDHYFISPTMKLNITSLNCNPSKSQFCNGIGEFFTWIRVYAESGGKPQTWPPSEQGSTFVNNCDYMYWRFGIYGHRLPENYFMFAFEKLLMAYYFLGLSLPLLIIKLLLSQVKSIPNRVTASTAVISLYWGAAVVLGILAALLSVFKYVYYTSKLDWFYNIIIFILPLQAYLIPVSMIGAVIVSRNIEMPTPSLKLVSHITFCCSKRFKLRLVHTLVMFSVILVIFHSILEVVAIVFLLFIDLPRTLSYIILYISTIFFVIILLSQVFHLFFSNNGPIRFKKCCLVMLDVFWMMCSLGVVVCVVLIYFGATSHGVKIEGVKGLFASLIPSLALLAVGWYLKKKLFKSKGNVQQSSAPPLTNGYGATGNTDRSINSEHKNEV